MLTMSQRLCNYILFKLMGWHEHTTGPLCKKYVIALAPHTSNMDFILGLLYSRAKGMNCGFLMKKQWFFWPLGYVMKALGGIPVDRSRKTSLTDQIAAIAHQADEFGLCVTPEGTRSRTSEWKKGFYYIALKAGLPIYLYGLDYATKTIHCTSTLMPNGNIEEQMPQIKSYFAHMTGRHPQRFTI